MSYYVTALLNQFIDVEKLTRAIEEAGHALIAFLLTVEVGEVTIDRSRLPNDCGGRCKTDRDVEFSVHAQISFAGLVARQMFGVATNACVDSAEIREILDAIHAGFIQSGKGPEEANELTILEAERIFTDVMNRLSPTRARLGLERCIKYLYDNLTMEQNKSMQLIQGFLSEM